MFHIGGLIVFCGLLAQITAQDQTPPVTAAAEGPKGLLANLKDVLSNNLVPENVVDAIKDLPLMDFLKNQSGLLGKLPSFLNLVDLDITDTRLLEFGLQPSSDGHRLYATIPMNVEFNLKLPLIGSLLKAHLDLNITAEIETVTDDNGQVSLAVGDCSSPPASLKFTLLNGKGLRLTQAFLNSLTGVFTNVLPALVQSQVCPLINTLIGQLDVTLVRQLTDAMVEGMDFKVVV